MSAGDAPLTLRGAADRTAPRFGTVVIVGGGCYGSYYLRQLGRAVAAGALACRRVLVVDRDPGCQVARALAADAPPAAPGGPPQPQYAPADPAVADPFRAASIEVRLVVSDWAAFLWGYLAGDAPGGAAAGVRDDDAIVPSPLMPHLLYDWLLHRARARWPQRRVETVPLRRAPDTPWQRSAPDGTQYVSFAEWMCPVNCIEPRTCPETRGPRTWSLPRALAAYAAEEGAAGHPVEGPLIFHCTHRAYGVGMIDLRDVLAADRRLAAVAATGGARVLVATVSHCHGAANLLAVGDSGPAPYA